MIEEVVLEAVKSQVAVWVPIFILFSWLLRWVMQEGKGREDRAHERENALMRHNEKYQDILKRQSDLLEKQSHLNQEQSQQLKELATIIQKLKTEMETVREQVFQLWSRND